MFEFFIRKTIMKNLSKEDQDLKMLLKHKIKMEILGETLLNVLRGIPIAFLFTMLITIEHTLTYTIQCVTLVFLYCIFAIWFEKRFKNEIDIFWSLISNSLYTKRYVVRGNAISKEDFEVIKKDANNLYNLITMQRTNGFCYFICFEILKCLKKGKLMFIASKVLQDEKDKNGNKDYTMHVLYVNNGWCFDTYSQMQYPVEEVLKRMRARTFKIFNYKTVKEMTFEEFRNKYGQELKEWCQKNNCYQIFTNKE